MQKVDWYFDFISPFAYLQSQRFAELPVSVAINFRPVLFAGLLSHWEHKGPVEIPGKRRFTYRQVQWYAERHGIAFKFPPAHPFNPLKTLRLAIALGRGREKVMQIFEFIWREGRAPDDPDEWHALAGRLGTSNPDALIDTDVVKSELRRNTEEAAARGVFGVPTFVVGNELFWGVDATDMLLDYLANPAAFQSEEMVRVSDLPIGVMRK